MQGEKQEEFAYVEVIKKAMAERGWSPADLSRASRVTQASLSRLLEGQKDVKGRNLFKILDALGLLKTENPSVQPVHDPDCPLEGASQDILDACSKVREIIESEKHWGTSLVANINSFKAGLDNDINLEEIRKRLGFLDSDSFVEGTRSGTLKSPGGDTGRRQKAG